MFLEWEHVKQYLFVGGNEITFGVILMTLNLYHPKSKLDASAFLHYSFHDFAILPELDTLTQFLEGTVSPPPPPVSYAYYSKLPTAANLD